MKSTNNRAPLVFAVLITAAIAGTIGWTLRSRIHADADVAGAAEESPAIIAPGQATGPAGATSPNAASLLSRMPALQRDPRALLALNSQNQSKLIAAGRQKLQTRYASESVDAAWAQRKQQALEAASTSPQIEEIDAKPLSFNAHCRSSVCLVGADFASVTAATDWFTLYTMIAGPEMTNAAVQRTTNPDGSVHLQLYGKAR